jgi:ATP-binding cassette, subfamily B, bacterial CvaB/MchF/RaxB
MRPLTGRRVVPEIRQSEAAECGLACIAMVLGYHGHNIDVGSLRRRHPTSLNGLTLLGLISIATRMELSARALRLEPEQLGLLRLPAILHWDMDHFVVLSRVGRRCVLIVHDPARGVRRITATEASKRFTGIALELSPTQDFTRRADERSTRGCAT